MKIVKGYNAYITRHSASHCLISHEPYIFADSNRHTEISLKHVEGTAAALVRQKGYDEATVYINHIEPCRHCYGKSRTGVYEGGGVENILPTGKKLNVIWKDIDGNIQRKTFKGK